MLELSRSDVFVDMCVQRDYFAPDGVRRCRNAESALKAIKHVIALARWARVPLISCVDTRRYNEIGEECVISGDPAAPETRKFPWTLMPNRAVVQSDNCLCVPLDLLKRQHQTIFTKYHRDPYTNPKLDRLLTEVPVGRYVVFGAVLELSLRILVLGLVRRNRQVVVIDNACGFWSQDEAAMVLRQFAVKGCTLISAERFVNSELARRRPRDDSGARIRPSRSVA